VHSSLPHRPYPGLGTPHIHERFPIGFAGQVWDHLQDDIGIKPDQPFTGDSGKLEGSLPVDVDTTSKGDEVIIVSVTPRDEDLATGTFVHETAYGYEDAWAFLVAGRGGGRKRGGKVLGRGGTGKRGRGEKAILDLLYFIFEIAAEGFSLVMYAGAVSDGGDGLQNPGDPAVAHGQGTDTKFCKPNKCILVFFHKDDQVRFKGQEHLVVDIEIATNNLLLGRFRRVVAVACHSYYPVSKAKFKKHLGDAWGKRDDASRLRLLRFDTGTRRLGDTAIGAGDLENED